MWQQPFLYILSGRANGDYLQKHWVQSIINAAGFQLSRGGWRTGNAKEVNA
jgi:hypothetical protein